MGGEVMIGFAIHSVACLAAGTFLVVTEHPGWAWIPFVILACTSMTQIVKK